MMKQNIKTNHIKKIVENRLNSQADNELIATKPPDINSEEKSIPRNIRRTLAQIRTDKSPFLHSYLNKINPQTNPSPICHLCNSDIPNTKHLLLFFAMTPTSIRSESPDRLR